MRIIKLILKVFAKIIISLFIAAVMALVMMLSLSGPYVEPPEETPEQLPAIDELIPAGSRADSSVIVRVLFGTEIREMPLELYLIGVVAAEMPAEFEFEALKAQAVAARTNVLYRMNVVPNTRHPNAQVCTDYACCMAYSDDEYLREIWDTDYIRYITRIIGAVLDTDGIFMAYDDNPILAVFHSSSKDKTESSGNVWVSDLPYLVSVDSPETAQYVPDYVTTVSVTVADFRERVAEKFPGVVFDNDEDLWITEISLSESGRVSWFVIGGETVKGTELRSIFDLRSTAVSYEWIDDSIVFTVTGYGHGVGMSQYGANVMAMARNDFRAILTHYYTDVGITGP